MLWNGGSKEAVQCLPKYAWFTPTGAFAWLKVGVCPHRPASHASAACGVWLGGATQAANGDMPRACIPMLCVVHFVLARALYDSQNYVCVETLHGQSHRLSMSESCILPGMSQPLDFQL